MEEIYGNGHRSTIQMLEKPRLDDRVSESQAVNCGDFDYSLKATVVSNEILQWKQQQWANKRRLDDRNVVSSTRKSDFTNPNQNDG